MVKAICERVLVTQDIPKIKVISSQSVSIESKGSDSSLKLTFFVSNGNYPLMFYFLRFFRAGTSHRVVGSLNVSAYSFDDSSKAFASVRVGVNEVSPIREIDHSGRIIGASFAEGCMPLNDEIVFANREYRKCKFIVFKYVWDNWSNDKLVDGKKDVVKESFSEALEDLYEDLVDMEIIPGLFNPIAIVETAAKRLKKNNTSSTRAGRTVSVKVPNPKIKTSDMVSPLLILSELMDDTKVFDTNIFALPSTSNGNSRVDPDVVSVE